MIDDRPIGATGPAAADRDWSIAALLIVALCFAVNMIDRVNILIMSYIAPVLEHDWRLSPNQLGLVFSAGLAGMAAGALVIAPAADRFGRRAIILLALAMMSGGMIASSFSNGMVALVTARVVVGAGIGAVLAAMAAIAAESAPDRHRSLAVGLIQAGYPLAAAVTGVVVAGLITSTGWKPLLLAAGIITTGMLPLAFVVLKPDPTRPRTTTAARVTLLTLFDRQFIRPTLLLWLGFFAGFMVLYFMVSWIPKLSIRAGLSESNGIYAGALYNLGAFIGTVLMSVLSVRVQLRRIIPGFLIAAAAGMLVFGSVPMNVGLTLTTAFLIGMALQGGFCGMYPLATSVYPAEIRATGVGWAVGIGRGGAVVGPSLGGMLMTAKASSPALFAVFCAPLLVCALAAFMTVRRKDA